MHIFYASHDTPNRNGLSNSRIWWRNLYGSLLTMGNDITVLDYDLLKFRYLDRTRAPLRYPFDALREHLSEVLVDQVRDVHREKPIDLFFSYFYDAHVVPEAIQRIRDLGIPTMNWYCNASYQFHLVREIAPVFDFCLEPERYRLADYGSIGARAIHCPMAANPEFYYSRGFPQDVLVSFIGQAYRDRPEFISFLHKNGVPVHVWGTNWQSSWIRVFSKRVFATIRGRGQPAIAETAISSIAREFRHGPLGDKEMVETIDRSAINLGFSKLGLDNYDGKPNKQVRLRDFEVTMVGGFYLVEDYEGLYEFFEPGREIITFHTEAELVEKVKFYVEHESERNRIRAAARARALREHNWQRRFESVFSLAGLV